MKINQALRQGDVLLVRIPAKELRETKGYTPTKNKTLALGEATGHHHTFEGGDVEILEREDEQGLAVNARGMLVEVKEETILRHQEHDPITVPPGTYRRVIQSEYSAKALVRVTD